MLFYTMIKQLQKHLYLLQLEEYQNTRYWRWLRKWPIRKLIPRKNSLRWTVRTRLIFFLALPISFLVGQARAVAWASSLSAFLTLPLKKLIIWRAKHKLRHSPHLIKIVITGSYGKTTFKEMLAWVLKSRYQVLKTPANINTEIGIANVVNQSLKPKHQVFIVEAGAYRPGEIRDICRLVSPDFGVVTIIGLMHLERFGSVKLIKKTKLEIVPFIRQRDRLFLPPADNQFLDFFETITKIARQLNLDPKIIKKRLASFAPPAHRLQQLTLAPGVILLDDSYNANPHGAQRALQKLASFRQRQKIVITPGLVEFGRQQFRLNYELGQAIASIADIIVIVGKTNRRALQKGVSSSQRQPKVLFLPAQANWQTLLNRIIRPPAVVLLENDLPDHYF